MPTPRLTPRVGEATNRFTGGFSTPRLEGVADIGALRGLCIEAGAHWIGCQMTVDRFGFTQEDFIPEVKEYVGAATFRPTVRDADVSLFI